MSKYHVNERRSGNDRRRYSIAPKFPFYDSSGNLVTHDRRNLPDRRLIGIMVEWITDQELVLEFPLHADNREKVSGGSLLI